MVVHKKSIFSRYSQGGPRHGPTRPKYIKIERAQ